MSRKFQVLALPLICLGIAACPARASIFDLILVGQTAANSSLPSSVPIESGTPFRLDVLFTDAGANLSTGYGFYQATAVTADVGGVFYQAQNPSLYGVSLIDPTSGMYGPLYVVGAGIPETSHAFWAGYYFATPALSATQPGATDFSYYLGGLAIDFLLYTDATDPLHLTYDPAGGIGASITPAAEPDPVPEPGTLALAGAGLLALWRVRRQRA